MWSLAEITVELAEVDGAVALVTITTPVGPIELLGVLTFLGRVLHFDDAHIGGSSAGAVKRAGLNAIFRKLLVEADVDEIIVSGRIRTTGKNRGKKPRTIRFPRSSRHSGGTGHR